MDSLGKEKEIDHENIPYAERLYRVSVDDAGRSCERHFGSAKRNPHLRGFGEENFKHDYVQELTWCRASLQGFAGAERRTYIGAPDEL
jgi:hypothetical protein